MPGLWQAEEEPSPCPQAPVLEMRRQIESHGKGAPPSACQLRVHGGAPLWVGQAALGNVPSPGLRLERVGLKLERSQTPSNPDLERKVTQERGRMGQAGWVGSARGVQAPKSKPVCDSKVMRWGWGRP